MLENLMKLLCSPVEESRFLGIEIMKANQMEEEVIKELVKTKYKSKYTRKEIYIDILHLIQFRHSKHLNQGCKIMRIINNLRDNQ